MYYKCSFLLLGIFLCLHVFCRTHPTQIARHSFQELLTMFEVPVSESHPCLLLSLSAGGSYSINPTFKLKHLVVVGRPAFRGFYSKQSKMSIIDPIPHLHSNRRNQNKLAETMDCFRIWNQDKSDWNVILIFCYICCIGQWLTKKWCGWSRGEALGHQDQHLWVVDKHKTGPAAPRQRQRDNKRGFLIETKKIL